MLHFFSSHFTDLTYTNLKNDCCEFIFCFVSVAMWLSLYFLLFRKYGFDLVKVNETCSGFISL
jgi:hypothetical protein